MAMYGYVKSSEGTRWYYVYHLPMKLMIIALCKSWQWNFQAACRRHSKNANALGARIPQFQTDTYHHRSSIYIHLYHDIWWYTTVSMVYHIYDESSHIITHHFRVCYRINIPPYGSRRSSEGVSMVDFPNWVPMRLWRFRHSSWSSISASMHQDKYPSTILQSLIYLICTFQPSSQISIEQYCTFFLLQSDALFCVTGAPLQWNGSAVPLKPGER